MQRRAFQPQNGNDTGLSPTDLKETFLRQQQDQHDERKKNEKMKKKKEKRDLQEEEEAHVTAATGSTFSVYGIIRLVLGLLVTSCALSYFVTGDSLFWGHRPWYTRMDNLRVWIVRYWRDYSLLISIPYH